MRKIFIVVERRADYSRFRPILQELKKDPFFKIYLVVTGICLLPDHGKDIDYIKKDGFKISAEIPMFEENTQDSGLAMVKALSRVMLRISEEINKVKPDIVLTGFDIGANLATTISAAHQNIPVAHIQGGEVTGSIDESIRHAMSKFAHIHFPATKLSKERLIKMGENPRNIYVVGCPSIDVLKKTPKISKKELSKKYGIDFSKPFVLVIQHPVTSEYKNSSEQILGTIGAIKELKIQAIFLLPNNDAGYSKIIKSIKRSGMKWYPSISTKDFVNLYRNAWTIVGNSSSGIHESTTMKIPAVNIGTRQQGRERSTNVIDVNYDKREIKEALRKALFDNSFRNKIKNNKNPYGEGNSAKKIVKILKKVKLEGIIQKKFYE